MATGWRRWSQLIDGAPSGISERLFELAGVERGSRMSDVAPGYGELSLTAARAAGLEGTVLATDISAEMITFGPVLPAPPSLPSRNSRVVTAEWQLPRTRPGRGS